MGEKDIKEEVLEDLEPENGDDIKGGDRITNEVRRTRKFASDQLARKGVHVDGL